LCEGLLKRWICGGDEGGREEKGKEEKKEKKKKRKKTKKKQKREREREEKEKEKERKKERKKERNNKTVEISIRKENSLAWSGCASRERKRTGTRHSPRGDIECWAKGIT
jgi:hypothetical protein